MQVDVLIRCLEPPDIYTCTMFRGGSGGGGVGGFDRTPFLKQNKEKLKKEPGEN